MKKKVDTNSPEYNRQVAKVIAIVFALTASGGAILAYKITKAEAAIQNARPVPADVTREK